MSSKYNKKHYVPEDFQQILSNFSKTIILYKPKDIIDFAISYFISLERNVPLDKILKNKQYINTSGSESTLNNEQNLDKVEEKFNLDNSNSKDNLEDTESLDSNKRIPLTKEMEEMIKINEIEDNKLLNENNELEISATNSEKEKVKEFVSELFMIDN